MIIFISRRFLYEEFLGFYIIRSLRFMVLFRRQSARRRPNLTIYSLIPLELFKIRWKLNQTYRKHFEFRYKKNYVLSRFSSQKNAQQQ